MIRSYALDDLILANYKLYVDEIFLKIVADFTDSLCLHFYKISHSTSMFEDRGLS